MKDLDSKNSEFSFAYRHNNSFQANFNEWYFVNTSEREAWGEARLDREAAFKIFSKIYSFVEQNG